MLYQLIIKILFRKDVNTMAVIYATLIIKGKKTFADVPDKIKDKVKEVLIDLDCPELAE
ncbi:MAG: CD1375 family protein [Faecalibacterium prausnitzii]|nr:CD1375 family protein [Faecalibacterium prausnitzii]